MRRIIYGGCGILLALLAACVTINVYFPAAAVQQAADRIIKDVYGQKAQPPSAGSDSTAPVKQGLLDTDRPGMLAASALAVLVRPAEAQANINISTPVIERLRQSMASRFPKLKPYLNSGAVGLTGDGLLAARNLNAVPLKDRRRVQQLVQQDNHDRNALYQAIAQANGHPDWADRVRNVFARRWISNAHSGWWYQQNGQWRRK